MFTISNGTLKTPRDNLCLTRLFQKSQHSLWRVLFFVGRGLVSRRFAITLFAFSAAASHRPTPMPDGSIYKNSPVLFTFWGFYGIIILDGYLLDKLEFDEVNIMIDITAWMKNFLQTLDETFENRVWFVGLQGSYGRDEATETSDIDIVVILDELSAMDIQAYHNMLDNMSHRELICGFLSGKKEIMNWEPSDLFQFCHDTTPIKGSLDEVMAVVDESAVNRAIKIGVCNIFHGCVHNMLHEKNEDILRGLYKSASFVVQAIVFKQTGN